MRPIKCEIYLWRQTKACMNCVIYFIKAWLFCRHGMVRIRLPRLRKLSLSKDRHRQQKGGCWKMVLKSPVLKSSYSGQEQVKNCSILLFFSLEDPNPGLKDKYSVETIWLGKINMTFSCLKPFIHYITGFTHFISF